MAIKYVNNYSTTVVGNFNSAATSITVTSVAGLSALTGGDVYYMTLYQLNTGVEYNVEIVKVTAVDIGAKALTIVRGQDNTVAINYTSGTVYIELRPIAASLNAVPQTASNLSEYSGSASTARGNIGAAPAAAKYIVQTANGELSNEQVLGSLATGILKNTTTTGVLSIAAASDINSTFGSQTQNYVYAAPSGSSGSPTFRALVAGDIPTLNQNTTGYATHLAGGNSTTLLGAVPYQSNANVTTLLSPNTTTSKRFLTQTGTGTNGAAPGWNAIVDGDVPSALTGKTYNGLSLTANATGFSVAGGTTSKTLTVSNSVTLAGTDGTTITLPGSSGTVALNNQTMYIGTTPVAINRASASLSLTGVNIDGTAGSASAATTSTNLAGGNSTTLLGAVPYQSNTNTTTLLSPNTSTSKRFLTQTGTGTNGAAPGWNAIVDADVPSALTGKTYNGLTLTAAATGFTVAGGTSSKTLTVNNTLGLSGTDGSTLNIGAGGTLGSAAYTASTAYEPAITTLANSKGGTGQNSSAWNGMVKVTAGTWATATAGTDFAKPDTASSWAANQTFNNSTLRLLGSSTGVTTFTSSNASATNYTFYAPAANSYGLISSYHHTISGPTAARTYTLPDADTTVVGTTATQTLTNKTLSTGTAISAEVTNTSTAALQVAVGTSAQRPTGANGKIRFNSDIGMYEGYAGTAWSALGGAQAGGAIYENSQTISANYTLTSGKNGHSVGPISISNGVTVTVPSGARWVIS